MCYLSFCCLLTLGKLVFYLALLLYWVCRLYMLILLARVVLDFVQIFKPDWTPEGIVLVIASYVYKLTDPPLRFLGKFIPPLRMGGVALDVGFVVLYFGIKLIQSGLSMLLYSLASASLS